MAVPCRGDADTLPSSARVLFRQPCRPFWPWPASARKPAAFPVRRLAPPLAARNKRRVEQRIAVAVIDANADAREGLVRRLRHGPNAVPLAAEDRRLACPR